MFIPSQLVDTTGVKDFQSDGAIEYEEKVGQLFPKFSKPPVTRLRQIAPIKMAQLIHKYAYFAGGSVASYLLGIDFSDYDLYFRTLEDYENFHKEMNDYCGRLLSKRKIVIQDSKIPKFDGYQLLEMGYTWTGSTEFYRPLAAFHSIGFLTGDPLSIINTFDLSCCQAAYDPQLYKFITTPAFDETKITKKGTIEVYHSPLKTANRVLKYIDRGISFSYGELMKIYMVLETEPLTTLHETSKLDPFTQFYVKSPHLSREEALRLLEVEMEKTND